jgi:predicted  nucleic acid-binding Zn-ribbon protein
MKDYQKNEMAKDLHNKCNRIKELEKEIKSLKEDFVNLEYQAYAYFDILVKHGLIPRG